MRRKLVVYCEQCGGAEPSGAHEFLVFHCLTFCSADCRDDYHTAGEAAREQPLAAAELATVARDMRREKRGAPAKPAKAA